MLAPKLSALRDAFPREDLEVVALYMQTCGGVPDLAAALRGKAEGLPYPVLNTERGTLEDPTRARFPWAPHGLVVDAGGRVVRTYAHVQDLETLREDLADLVATGRIPPRLDDPWRDFDRGSWVRVRHEDPGIPATVLRTVKSRGHEEVAVLDERTPDAGTADAERILLRRRLPGDPPGRAWVPEGVETLRVDGTPFACRVSRAAWKETNGDGVEHLWSDRLWVAPAPLGGEPLLRRETVRRGPGDREVRWTTRVLGFGESVAVGDRAIPCRLVERVTTAPGSVETVRTWTSPRVPGGEVRRETVLRTGAGERVSVRRVLDFHAVRPR